MNLYDSRTNPHPRGMIGEIIANKLLRCGWTEDRNPPTLDSVWWVHPTGDRRWGSLEFADKRCSLEASEWKAISTWMAKLVRGNR
jgi:hypothetical protein